MSDWAENPFRVRDTSLPSLIDTERVILNGFADQQQAKYRLWMTGVLSGFLDVNAFRFSNSEGKLLYPFERYEEYAEAGHSPITGDEFQGVVGRLVLEALK